MIEYEGGIIVAKIFLTLSVSTEIFCFFLVLPFDDFRCVFAWKLQRYLIQTFRTFLSSRNINLPYNDDTIKVQSKQKWHLNHDKNLDNGGFREKIHINICLSVHNMP